MTTTLLDHADIVESWRRGEDVPGWQNPAGDLFVLGVPEQVDAAFTITESDDAEGGCMPTTKFDGGGIA